MKQQLKNFLANLKRLYFVFFENRKPEDIQNDYHSGKWISKSELKILLEFEKSQMLAIIQTKENHVQDLMKSFNLNSFASYSALEKKYQSKLKK
jgi:hypothetical protein